MNLQLIRFLSVSFGTTSLLNILVVDYAFPKSLKKCQYSQNSVKILDESGGGLSGNSLKTLKDSPFKQYVADVSEYVFTKLDTMAQHQKTVCPEVTLFFVYRPLYKLPLKPVESYFTLEPAKSKDARNLISPWVRIKLEKTPKYTFQAQFLWNERQFFLDQALLSGINLKIIEPLTPLDKMKLSQYFLNYEKSLLSVNSNDPIVKEFRGSYSRLTQAYFDALESENDELTLKRLKREYSNALYLLSTDFHSAMKFLIPTYIPPDILWLCRHQLKVDFLLGLDVVPYYDVNRTIEQAGILNSAITETLASVFVTSENTKLQYADILDIKKMLNTDKYQITRLK
jgi:hypothetical protein